MDSLVELLPHSGLIRLGAAVHPCVVGPAGHLTVHGRELQPLTLADCDLIAVYAGAGGPEVSADLALRMARVDGEAALPPGAGWEASGTQGAAVEAVALFLAGATGTGSLRGTAVTLAHRLRVSLADATAMTVLAADALLDALPQAPAVDDGWTTYEVRAEGAATPAWPEAAPVSAGLPRADGSRDDDARETRRVRDLLARRFAQRLAEAPAGPQDAAADLGAAPDTAPAVAGRRFDRWGAPVEPSPPAAGGAGQSGLREVATGERPLAQGTPADAAGRLSPAHPGGVPRDIDPHRGGRTTAGPATGAHVPPQERGPAVGDRWGAGQHEHNPSGVWPPAAADGAAPVAGSGGTPRGAASSAVAGPRPASEVAAGWGSPAWDRPPRTASVAPPTWDDAAAPADRRPWAAPDPGDDHPEAAAITLLGATGTDLDAVALHLAQDLQTLADLHGVAR